MPTDQMALISAGPQVMHSRAVVAGTRLPVSVILDCLAAGMAAEEIVAEYPAVKCCGRARGGRLRRGAGTRGVAAATAVAVKFKLDENPPASSAAILADAGHDFDTVGQEGLSGAADPDEVTAAAAAGRVLISLDVGSGDICAYPPGSHAGIVVLRLTDQSAGAVSKAVGDLAALTNAGSLAGAVSVLQRGLLRIRHP